MYTCNSVAEKNGVQECRRRLQETGVLWTEVLQAPTLNAISLRGKGRKKKERCDSLFNTRSLAPEGCLCTPTMRNTQTYSLARWQLVSEGHLFPRQNLTNSVAALHTTIVWIPSASHTYRMFMHAHQCAVHIYTCQGFYVSKQHGSSCSIKSKGSAVSRF